MKKNTNSIRYVPSLLAGQTKVLLANKHVGTIKKEQGEHSGFCYRYYPKGGACGKSFLTLDLCQKSLECE